MSFDGNGIHSATFGLDLSFTCEDFVWAVISSNSSSAGGTGSNSSSNPDTHLFTSDNSLGVSRLSSSWNAVEATEPSLSHSKSCAI